MINFDSRGCITPNQIISLSLQEFEKTFCHNAHRKVIFENYITFIEKLHTLGLTHFYQYIDGSFVTTKNYPKDIDFVTFIHFEFFHQNITKMMEFRNKWLDCFFAPIYPQNHASSYRNDLEHFE